MNNFTWAIDRWRVVGAQQERSRTERALATVYAAAGRRDEAVGLFWRVVASARQRGAVLEERLALGQLQKLGISTSVTDDMVKDALEAMREQAPLANSPLLGLSSLAVGDGEAGLPARLLKSIDELCASSRPRDSETGRVLRSYYVGRAGTHEIVAEQLHTTHSTFYRRLHQGISLVAKQLGNLNSPGP